MLLSQEREYKEALEAFNEKNKEKVQLITKLMEVSFVLMVMKHTFTLSFFFSFLVLFNLCLGFQFDQFHVKQLVSESEKLRMKKLEELSKSIETKQ